jgi:hypothetical protein
MLHVHISQVKVDTLHEHVRRDEHTAVRIGKYGAVIAYAVLSGLILLFEVFGEPVDKAELAEFSYFHV